VGNKIKSKYLKASLSQMSKWPKDQSQQPWSCHGRIRADGPDVWHVASFLGTQVNYAYKYSTKGPENGEERAETRVSPSRFRLGFSFNFFLPYIFSFFVDLGLC